MYGGSSLTDIQRKEIMQNVFLSNDSFHFHNIDDRQFEREWLKQFSWLCYSPKMKSGFCLACILFGYEFVNDSKIKLFEIDPVRVSCTAVILKGILKGRERRNILIETGCFMKILQPYFIVSRKNW